MKIQKPFILLLAVIAIAAAIYFLQTSQLKPLPEVEKISITPAENLSGERQQILLEKEAKYKKATELVQPDGYLNVENITLKELIGKKVILIDFWTYSCINCIRTFPYLNAWYEKYRDSGFVIIGVHTPEFEFETKYENVEKAVEKYGLKYPVVQDNNYFTWRAYRNNYWPHKYLIDIDGYIVYDHIGEGGYEETEKLIQNLLLERAGVLNEAITIDETMAKPKAVGVEFSRIRTPEIYLGYEFTRGNFGSPEGIKPDKAVFYTIPEEPKPDFVYLEGTWKNNKDNMELASETGRVLLVYDAKIANLVASSEEGSMLEVLLDNAPHKEIEVSSSDLYTAASAEDYGLHTLEINVKGPGFRIYTFTFG